jgi:hypothetical protein
MIDADVSGAADNVDAEYCGTLDADVGVLLRPNACVRAFARWCGGGTCGYWMRTLSRSAFGILGSASDLAAERRLQCVA